MNVLNLKQNNTVCVACGAVAINNTIMLNHQTGKYVQKTRDHMLLKSLGGTDTEDNLACMCDKCNFLRGNKFAEITEFLAWFRAGQPAMPFKRNFSYLNRNFIHFDKPEYAYLKDCMMKGMNEVPVLKPKTKSVFVRRYTNDKGTFEVYKHPLFGESEIKVDDFEETELKDYN